MFDLESGSRRRKSISGLAVDILRRKILYSLERFQKYREKPSETLVLYGYQGFFSLSIGIYEEDERNKSVKIYTRDSDRDKDPLRSEWVKHVPSINRQRQSRFHRMV